MGALHQPPNPTPDYRAAPSQPTDGGRLIEGYPSQCPAGHAWGPPVRGVVRMIVGWHPCHCPGSRGKGGHRTVHCEKPGCPDPWWYDGGHEPAY